MNFKNKNMFSWLNFVHSEKKTDVTTRALFTAKNSFFMPTILLFLLFTAFATLTIHAQEINLSPNRIPIHQNDSFVWVQVYDGDVKKSHCDDDKTYYWLKAKQIHSSKGGFDGSLLHGPYTALYKNDVLKEKGQYAKGLKTGTWKEWFTNGEIKTISHWKNGLLHGYVITYNEQGKPLQKNRYRNGNLNGKQITYTDSSATVVKFKNGKALQPKTKKIKPQKPESKKTAESNTETSTPDESKPKTKKTLFKRTKKEKVTSDKN